METIELTRTWQGRTIHVPLKLVNYVICQRILHQRVKLFSSCTEFRKMCPLRNSKKM